MAIGRCSSHGAPRRTKKGVYVGHHFPVGHPNSGLICGVPSCENIAEIWLKEDEEKEYRSGRRIFGIHTHTAKVILQ